MNNIIPFPAQEHVLITEGTDRETGERLFLLEYVDAEGRTVVGSYSSLREVAEASMEWERDGVKAHRDLGGAA